MRLNIEVTKVGKNRKVIMDLNGERFSFMHFEDDSGAAYREAMRRAIEAEDERKLREARK